jgi:hypothetical protein
VILKPYTVIDGPQPEPQPVPDDDTMAVSRRKLRALYDELGELIGV